jgi:DNA-binding response OmpR family regulator
MEKILVIEDEPAMRKMTAQALRFEGFDVLEAPDGKSGVATALRSVPDLVVCDVMMPDMDGFGVIHALRSDSRTALTPFIFLTAMAANGDLRHGMTEGADDYLTKPFQIEDLIGSVRRRLEKRKRQIEEGERKAEEVSLAVAASVPQEILETLDQITNVTNSIALKYAAQDAEVAAMQEVVALGSLRLRRIMRRLHLYSQLPQLYANRFELVRNGSLVAAEAVIERVARAVCRSWKREPDLAIASEAAQLPIGEEYLELLVEELVDNACKFSKAGSCVEVMGRAKPEYWSLTVCNRGTGLSVDQTARIGAFKQFWSGNVRPRGLGLGLALTEGVARLHGAEFVIESDADVISASILIPLES